MFLYFNTILDAGCGSGLVGIEMQKNGYSNSDYYFDEKLYKQRYAIERTNVWMDGFRSVLNRFDDIELERL